MDLGRRYGRLGPRAWAHVDHPVAVAGDLHVVLDQDDGVARVDQAIQLRHQPSDVRRMKTGGWLIQNAKCVTSLGTLQLGGEFDSLRFTTGKLSRGLAQSQVTASDLPSMSHCQTTQPNKASWRRSVRYQLGRIDDQEFPKRLKRNRTPLSCLLLCRCSRRLIDVRENLIKERLLDM